MEWGKLFAWDRLIWLAWLGLAGLGSGRFVLCRVRSGWEGWVASGQGGVVLFFGVLVAWLAGCLAGGLVGRLVSSTVTSVVAWLVGWLAGYLAAGLPAWVVVWVIGLFPHGRLVA